MVVQRLQSIVLKQEEQGLRIPRKEWSGMGWSGVTWGGNAHGLHTNDELQH